MRVQGRVKLRRSHWGGGGGGMPLRKNKKKKKKEEMPFDQQLMALRAEGPPQCLDCFTESLRIMCLGHDQGVHNLRGM